MEHRKEIDAAIYKVLNSGSYILGDEVRKFEKRFAKYIGVKYVIGVASGTDALFLSMRVLGIGTGDEVITVSHTAIATVSAIVSTGATPVLVDIRPWDYTIDPTLIEAAITKRTRAILPVHIYGTPCQMSSIMAIAKKHKLHVIEDCAQATGAKFSGRRVGSIGTLGCFSFYPTKNLGCLGDGGAITTNSFKLAKKLMSLREYGWKKRYISEFHGYNSRLDELQAAILNVKLKYLDMDNIRRQSVAIGYNAARFNHNSVYHLYVTRSENRASAIKSFNKRKLQTAIHYPVPVHKQPGYKNLVRVSGALAHTEQAAKEIISLPMYPQLI